MTLSITPVPLNTARLRLEVLSVSHAAEAFVAFDDARLHEFIGGAPLSCRSTAERYARLETGRSADGAQLWFNWMLREAGSGELVGTVQATLQHDGASDADDSHDCDCDCDCDCDGVIASLAWVVALPFQRRGYATEAARAVTTWLGHAGIVRTRAYVHPRNLASAAIARSLGMARTTTLVDGEVLWIGPRAGAPVDAGAGPSA